VVRAVLETFVRFTLIDCEKVHTHSPVDAVE